MKKNMLQHPAWQTVTMLFVLPTFYFITSALLNYNLGISSLWKVIAPIFDEPSNQRLGFNINLLIIFGPIVSLVISLFRLVQFNTNSYPERFDMHFSVKRYSWSWISLTLAVFCLAAMFLYSIGENCNCH